MAEYRVMVMQQFARFYEVDIEADTEERAKALAILDYRKHGALDGELESEGAPWVDRIERLEESSEGGGAGG